MKKIIILGSVMCAPLLTFAAATVDTIIYRVGGWVDIIIPILIALAIAYFIWGVISFMISSDEEAKKNGRAKIINGLIGLFVILAFWGIIALVKNTFSISGSADYSDSIADPY